MPRQPVFRWILTITCKRARHYLSREIITAPNQVMAEQRALDKIRTKRLTDHNGVPWDMWSLMGRDASGRPLRIVATGTHMGVTWSDTVKPVRRFGRGA